MSGHSERWFAASRAALEARAATTLAATEVTDDGASDPAVNKGTVHKAWRHGFLPMGLEEYLEVLDWTARQIAPGRSGAMDARLPPILEHLKIAPGPWVKLIENFGQWCHGAVGSPEKMAEEALRRSRR